MSFGAMVGIAIASVAFMLLLIAGMRRLSLRFQFMVLLVLGISIGFVLLVMVQMPSFPEWFGVLLLVVVFFASTFGTRIFLKSLALEDKKTEDEARAGLLNHGQNVPSNDPGIKHPS